MSSDPFSKFGEQNAAGPPPALNRKGIWQSRYSHLEAQFLQSYIPGTVPLNNWMTETFDSPEDVTCFVRAAYAYFKRKGLVLKTARRKEEPLKVWCQLKHSPRGERTKMKYDLSKLTTTPEGWLILPEDADFLSSKDEILNIGLGSVGRHLSTNILCGSYMTNFADSKWTHDYELVWLHPEVKR